MDALELKLNGEDRVCPKSVQEKHNHIDQSQPDSWVLAALFSVLVFTVNYTVASTAAMIVPMQTFFNITNSIVYNIPIIVYPVMTLTLAFFLPAINRLMRPSLVATMATVIAVVYSFCLMLSPYSFTWFILGNFFAAVAQPLIMNNLAYIVSYSVVGNERGRYLGWMDTMNQVGVTIGYYVTSTFIVDAPSFQSLSQPIQAPMIAVNVLVLIAMIAYDWNMHVTGQDVIEASADIAVTDSSDDESDDVEQGQGQATASANSRIGVARGPGQSVQKKTHGTRSGTKASRAVAKAKRSLPRAAAVPKRIGVLDAIRRMANPWPVLSLLVAGSILDGLVTSVEALMEQFLVTNANFTNTQLSIAGILNSLPSIPFGIISGTLFDRASLTGQRHMTSFIFMGTAALCIALIPAVVITSSSQVAIIMVILTIFSIFGSTVMEPVLVTESTRWAEMHDVSDVINDTAETASNVWQLLIQFAFAALTGQQFIIVIGVITLIAVVATILVELRPPHFVDA
jgi:hypothetical protein